MALVSDRHLLHVCGLKHADVSNHLSLQLFQLERVCAILRLDVALHLQ